MFCFRARRLIIPYLEGALDERVSSAFARHLESCPKCADEVALVRRAGNALRKARTPAQEPAADLWSRIEREIAPPVAQPARRPGMLGLKLAGATAACALLCVIALMSDRMPVSNDETTNQKPVMQAAVPKDARRPDEPPISTLANDAKPPAAPSWSTASVPRHRSAVRKVRIARVEPHIYGDLVAPASTDVVVASTEPSERVDLRAASSSLRGKRETEESPSPVAVASIAALDRVDMPARSMPAPAAPRVMSAPAAASEAASSGTTVDKLNDADDDSRVSALFSYP